MAKPTFPDIAARAGVSIGSLYQYFPNKEALVHALIERHDAAMWSVFTHHATAAIGRPFAVAIPTIIDALFAAHLVDPELHRVVHQQISWVGALAILQTTNQRSRAVVEAHLARIAQVIAAIRGVEPDELVRATGDNALRALPRLS